MLKEAEEKIMVRTYILTKKEKQVLRDYLNDNVKPEDRMFLATTKMRIKQLLQAGGIQRYIHEDLEILSKINQRMFKETTK